MKSLLTQEMSMQTGSKRRSPSIIARLMGLDGLPPHSSSPHRQPKSVENQQRRPVTSEKARGKETYGDHESLGRDSMDEHRFKDVFEVLDAEKENSSISLSQRRVRLVSANQTETEMAFIRQKFMEAKGLSTDEKLRCYKEFDNKFDLTKKQLKKRSGLKPTEIVVLKPNLGKSQTTGRILPSQSSSCDEVRADRRLPCTANWESKAISSLKANEDVSHLSHKPRDSRAITRIVSRQMKASCGNDRSMNFEISRFKSYTEDESSSGSASSSESKLVSMISRARIDFNRKNNRGALSSMSPESSVSKETMTRLSERWKLAQKSEQETEIRRSNTLAEMLATSDREVRQASVNGITFGQELSKRFKSNVGQSEFPEPIGISSKDGWKSIDRTIMHEDRTCGYTIVLLKKLNGLVKGSSFHHREFFLSDKPTPICTNSHFSDSSSSEINRASSSKLLYIDGELSKENFPALKTHSSLSVHADSNAENGWDYEDTKSTPSLKSLEFSTVTSLTNPDMFDRPTKEDHSSIPQLQIQESAKEGDQPSPVSILQTSLHNEFSFSSECFEGLNADLQGLRKQLQLLKHESTTYNKGAMLVSRDEIADQEVSSMVTDKTPRELITINYMKPSRDTEEKELQWPNLEDDNHDIEVIGKEIEEMLTDELIAEIGE